MSLGTTLGELRTMLKAEVGDVIDEGVASGEDPQLNWILRNKQDWLFSEYDWPHMRVTADVTLAVGQRYYDFPETISLERPFKVRVKSDDIWFVVNFGIDERHLSLIDSDANDTSSPVERLALYKGADTQQFEVWPVPDSEQTLRFTGQKPLAALEGDGIAADLDDLLIVWFAAAEILTRRKQPDAQAKLSLAQARLNRLKSTGVSDPGMFVMGGSPREEPKIRPTVAITKEA